MARCARCRIDYPPGLTAPLRGSHNYSGASVCGICAVTISNELHNKTDTQFAVGILANTQVQLAMAFREHHPKLTPHSNPTRAHWIRTPKKH